jgi:hypothetical protein
MKKSFLTVPIIIMLINCQNEIGLPALPYAPRVIIQGFIEPDSVPIVYFNRTVPYLSGTTNAAELVIRNARVRVSSSEGSDVLVLDSTFVHMDCRYSYFYKGSIPVKKNTYYTLEIADSAKVYTASATTSLMPVTIDSVTYTPAFKDLYGNHEGVITWFKDIADQENFYRFEMLREIDSTVRDVTLIDKNKPFIKPCLGGDTVMFIEVGRSVYNDQNLQGSQVKIVIEPAITHLVPTEVFVRIQTIDKAMYEFYDQIDEQKLSQYNPFVEPLFIRDGQFGKDAAGFFGSMIKSDAVRFMVPADD